MKKIGFIILTWNSEKCIKPCLDSIFSLDANRLEGQILVVDNGSTDQTESEIQKAVSAHRNHTGFACDIQKLDKNYGTTISRNIGIRKLMNEDIEYLCILDSDTVVNTDAILTLTHVLDKDAFIGIVGPRMKDKNGVYQHSGRNIPTLTEKVFKVLPIRSLREKGQTMECSVDIDGKGETEVGYLLSACWMMRKEIFKEVGLLDEKIFYAPEDVEFCIRCHKAGYTILYCRDAEIIHEWQRLSRKKLFSKHNFEHLKGLGYLFRKHGYLFKTDKIEEEYQRNRKSVML